jgi:general stress protein 26
MNPTQLNAAETKDRIQKAFEKIPFVSFGTLGTNGWPNVRALMVVVKDGVETLWFATETTSSKIAELKANPKAILYGYDVESMLEFRLFGKVEMLTDSASRQKIWSDEMIQHFPDGIDSPNMVVLRFDTESGFYDCYGKEIGKF